MAISIRSAVAADQPVITRIVRAARINPRDLDWQRFLVAEEDGRVIGVGQVKPHPDGSRELASLAVLPKWQGQGVGGVLVRALLARERGPLHLMCTDWLESYYARFGFHRLAPDELPPYFWPIMRFGRIVTLLASIARKRVQLIVMRWDADSNREL